MSAPARAAALAAALAAAAAAASSCAAGDARRPNVLLLVMDTTRGDRVSVGGYARRTTPRLEEFARDATTFTDAWAPCCWTGPSHASLFTGLHPRRHRYLESHRPYLGEEATTLAERLRDAGWRTACFTNNDLVTPEYGLTQGFEAIVELCDDPERRYPYAPETHRQALAWALDADPKGRPFFLFVNDMEPHLPYAPPVDAAMRFVRERPPAEELQAARAFNFPWSVGYALGKTDIGPKRLALLSDLYDAEIETLDAAIGALLDRLRDAKTLDDTIVVVTSDHGESLGEHRRLGHLLSMHRQTLHVPLVVRFPGAFDGGRRVPEVVRLEDVAPTILELCGLPPADLDGRSLTRDLPGRIARGAFGEQSHAIPEVSRAFPDADFTPFRTAIESVYDGKLHLVLHSTGAAELYDVAADPLEERNLADARPQDVERLRALLRQ